MPEEQPSAMNKPTSEIGNQKSEITNPKPPRPFSVTLVAFGVFIIAGIHLARAVQAILQWNNLAGLPGVSPLYLVLTGLLWAAAGFPLSLALWRGSHASGKAARLFALAYTLYFWADRLLVARSLSDPDRRPSLPFAALLNLILLLFVLWVFTRRKVSVYLGEYHDIGSENSKAGRAAG